jgi:hypothetical protein
MSNFRRSREFTCAVLDAVEQGVLNKDTLIADLLGWMSEADVEEFVRKNDLLEAVGLSEDEDEDEESDPLDDFNYVGSRHHY